METNGYIFEATNDEVECFVLSVVTDKLELPAIAAWLKKNSKKLKSSKK